MSVFNLPDLGEGLQEAELVAWHVAEGDHVVADQPLVSVETEKAVVEVPSPQSGRIARLCAQTGERVKVGAALVEFDEGPQTDTGTVVGVLAESARKPAAPAGAPAAPPAPRPRRARPRRSPACAGRWRSTWRARMPRSCRRRSSTRPTFTPGTRE